MIQRDLNLRYAAYYEARSLLCRVQGDAEWAAYYTSRAKRFRVLAARAAA